MERGSKLRHLMLSAIEQQKYAFENQLNSKVSTYVSA